MLQFSLAELQRIKPCKTTSWWFNASQSLCLRILQQVQILG